MSLADTKESSVARIDGRVTLGGCLMLIDTLWGVLAVLGIGFEPLREIPLDISLVAGLPAYVFDARSKVRVIVLLPALYLFRWLVWSHSAGAAFHAGPPWRGTVLLIVASALLQWFKLQNSGYDLGRQ